MFNKYYNSIRMLSCKEKDTSQVIQTFKYRIKGNTKQLDKIACNVNLVWNYCNKTTFQSIKQYSKFLSGFDLQKLTSGTSKIVDISAATVQYVCQEYTIRRVKSKKRKLKWRSYKKSLGWIPFKAASIKIQGSKVYYHGAWYNLWYSRKIEGRILSGSFSQDSKKHWYVNITCEVNKLDTKHTIEEVGIDLGLKTSAVLSDGIVINNNNEYRRLELKLSKAQRARKTNQVKNIHNKIKNKRKDYLHKETTKLVKKYNTIYVGDVSGKFLQKTNGKSSSDASVSTIRNMLIYKAIRHSGYCYEVNESFSTITCSACLNKTGPSGLSDLGVREWTCSDCNTCHNRDVNAANNILRFGRESLKGVP